MYEGIARPNSVCRIDELAYQYSQLEDEFRLALQLEASRFQEVLFLALCLCGFGFAGAMF